MSKPFLPRSQSTESSITPSLSTPTTSNILCCTGCQEEIKERQVLSINHLNQNWHVTCLRCHRCKSSLDGVTTCNIIDGLIICNACTADSKWHSLSRFSSPTNVWQCAKCSQPFEQHDWVRQATRPTTTMTSLQLLLYHLACFTCDYCDGQLSTGDQFGFDDSCRLLCRKHYVRAVTSSSMSSDDSSDSDKDDANQSPSNIDSISRRRRRHRRSVRHRCHPTRIRTIFSNVQLAAFEEQLSVNSSPDCMVIDDLAQRLGLSRRVIQVWFQNARARIRKQQNNSTEQQRGIHYHQNSTTSESVLTSSFGTPPYFSLDDCDW